MASTSFFITNDNILYGCGANQRNALLGLLLDEDVGQRIKHQYEPELIPLDDVVDAQPSYKFSVALCCSDDEKLHMIIHHWCRLYSVPDDIILLLVMFAKISKVYSTAYKWTWSW